MSVIVSEVGICKLAMSLLGEKQIGSIDSPTTKPEIACSIWYDHSRKQALALHTWNEASKRASIPAASAAPAFGYDRAFPVPNDFIALNYIGEEVYDRLDEYVIETHSDGNTSILCDEDAPLKINYVWDLTNVRKMSSTLIGVIAARVAINTCYDITGSNQNVSRAEEYEIKMINEAKSVDGQQRPPITRDHSKFVEQMQTGVRNSENGLTKIIR